MSETPAPSNGPSSSTFTRGFIPGLVIGLLVGLAVGAIVLPLLDQPPPISPSEARSGQPRTTRARDEFPVPDNKPADPAAPEKKPDEPAPPSPAPAPK